MVLDVRLTLENPAIRTPGPAKKSKNMSMSAARGLRQSEGRKLVELEAGASTLAKPAGASFCGQRPGPQVRASSYKLF